MDLGIEPKTCVTDPYPKSIALERNALEVSRVTKNFNRKAVFSETVYL
jgi:hypothetical protein